MSVVELLQIEQRTQAWYDARLGRATASKFRDVLAKIGKGEAAARRNYRAQLVVERLTGKMPERFATAAMEWGIETEELARTTYMLLTGNIVDEPGFYQHPKLMAGASPDGDVTSGKEKGGLEIKCFNTANHIQALRDNEMPKEHIPQVQGQMWLAGYKWVDFVSFDPDMPENAQIYIERIYRDKEYIKMLEAEIIQFLQEVDAEVAFITDYRRGDERS